MKPFTRLHSRPESSSGASSPSLLLSTSARIKAGCALFMLMIVTGIVPQQGYSAEAMMHTRADDYTAIQTLIVKYAHVYDSRDIEGYVGIFTEDAQFTFNGTTLNGRDDIRAFITRAANTPPANPDIHSYHSISNTLIEFVSDTEAHHRSYWQIFSAPTGGPVTVGSIGVYEDTIVKQNGQWLIKKRNIPL